MAELVDARDLKSLSLGYTGSIPVVRTIAIYMIEFQIVKGIHRLVVALALQGALQVVVMTSLKKAPNGDWYSRKAIPADVKEACKDAYGLNREERFRRPPTFPQIRAIAELRDWDALISSRIDHVRSLATGATIDLTQRRISALCGEWYYWFVAQHEEDPGDASTWDSLHASLTAIYERFDSLWDDRDDEDEPLQPTVQRHVDAKVQELGRVPAFLAEKGKPTS